MLLYDFIETNRELIVTRTREKVASRIAPRPTELEIVHGVPLFLDQLCTRLRPGVEPGETQIGASASLHGAELLKSGLTIGQVVRDYGNICQAITELAVETQSQITNEDFSTLNLCLDVAIAEAVSEYARQREAAITGEGFERLGFLTHELRNLLSTATLALEVVRSGTVGLAGSTGKLLEKSLAGMSDLVNRSLAEVRLEAEAPRHERIFVADVLEDIEIAATLQASIRGVQLTIEPVELGASVYGDSHILGSIVTNLLQNACKFTPPHGHVTVRTRVTSDRVFIDVADECGGLPPGKADELFWAYEQRGANRSGLGLGLAISLKGAHAIGGDIQVRDLPGTGCIFTVDLRRSDLV